MRRTRTDMIHIDQQEGYGIFDLETQLFIGFQKVNNYTNSKIGGVKSIWKTPGYAASAFKFHTGKKLSSCPQFEVRRNNNW